MKIRWRQHEIIFVSMVGVIAAIGFWWKMDHMPSAVFDDNYRLPFLSHHLAFNFYRNLLLPQIAIFVTVYVSVLWINLLIVPRLIAHKKAERSFFVMERTTEKQGLSRIVSRFIQNYVWLFIQLGLVFLLMGTSLNIIAYYLAEYQFHDTGFTFFPGNGHHAQTLLNWQEGFENAAAFLLGYGIYILFRELIIAWLERSPAKRNYRVMIFNHITSFAVVFLSIPFFIASFNLAGNDFFNSYYATFIPVFLVFLLNTYWLFPLTSRKPFLSKSFLWKLFLSCGVCALPFLGFPLTSDQSPFPYFVLCWMVLLLVVTPTTWLFFQQRRDKILQLKGAERELIKSVTNLQSLRSQINPHFLYNILNTLYGTALQENADRTANGIQQLGDMMRFMLDENHLDYIPMSREIEYLNNYIALQKLRFPTDSAINIESHINASDCHHQIAPMLLIPFVENAFKHGISLNAASWIKIRLACDEQRIHFEVRNSLHPALPGDPEKERSGIGLVNVLERLKLIYPDKFEFSANGDGVEFFVMLSIQLNN